MRQRLALNRIASLLPIGLFFFADILSPAPQAGVAAPTAAGTSEETWEAQARPFEFAHEAVRYALLLSGASLVLIQPRRGKQTDTCLPGMLIE